MGAEGGGGGVKAAEKNAGVKGGEKLGEENGGAEDDGHGDEDDGEGAVGGGFITGLAVAVEDVDERDGGDAADQEITDHVREDEGEVVRVGGVAGAKNVGDVFGAEEAEQAGHRGRQAEQDGGRGCRVAAGEGEETAAGGAMRVGAKELKGIEPSLSRGRTHAPQSRDEWGHGQCRGMELGGFFFGLGAEGGDAGEEEHGDEGGGEEEVMHGGESLFWSAHSGGWLTRLILGHWRMRQHPSGVGGGWFFWGRGAE